MEDLTMNLSNTSKNLLLSGAHGFIGHTLKQHLQGQGYTLKILGNAKHKPDYTWDDLSAIDWACIEGVIHLAGENIFARWTHAKKKRLWSSRIALTQALATSMAQSAHPPQVFICASAVGIYGDTGQKQVDEQAPPGSNFLAQLAKAWEQACQPAQQAGIRTVSMRLGIVLSAQGGALAKMLPVFKAGLGGPLGNGKQLQSFVALQDVLSATSFTLKHPHVQGPVNITCPQVLSQKAFAKTLAQHLGRPCILPTPAWLLRLVLGQMANEVLLANACASPQKLLEAGFTFELPDLASILASHNIGPPN